MEKNTYATSAYIDTSLEAAFRYLGDVKNLSEWTLGSRMQRKVDEDTWIGTASGYQRELYYHVRRNEGARFRGIEWHCGFEQDRYFKCYPALLFPSSYLGSDEPGVYFHWISFIDPARRTPMIMQGIHLVHTAEIRSLKGILERRAGRSEAARGRHEVRTSTIYVDAEADEAAGYLGDLRNFAEWAYLVRPAEGRPIAPEAGDFVDEYGHEVEVRSRVHVMGGYHIVEIESHYPRLGLTQRSPLVLMPCRYAFGDPRARGLIQHRISFWSKDGPPRNGKLQIEDYGAESMSLKRILERRAGRLDAFARGGSYLPEEGR